MRYKQISYPPMRCKLMRCKSVNDKTYSSKIWPMRMMTYLPIWFKQLVSLPLHMMYRFHPVPEVLSNTSFKIQILCQFLALFLYNILYIQKHHVNPDGPASRSYHCLRSQNITSLNRFDKRSVELCQEKQSLFNSTPPPPPWEIYMIFLLSRNII